MAGSAPSAAAARNAVFNVILPITGEKGRGATLRQRPVRSVGVFAVAVVGPCLPAVTLELELLKTYYEERFARGFEYAFVVPGMTRVVQSAGRLIRSETDTGVVVLACRRFLKNPYRRHLPADWYLDDPGELSCTDVGARVAAFFARNRAKEEATKAATKEVASG